MAYEKIYQFPDKIKAEWMKLDAEAEKDGIGRAELWAIRRKQDAYLDSLFIFYETICQTLKFKHQKQYTQAIIRSINPALADGYFKASKTKK